MVVAEHLRHLSEEHIKEMYKCSQSNEAIFRNILIDLADNKEEVDFFRNSGLDEIFDKYVKIEGYVTRLDDFKVGPTEERFRELNSDEALISIRTSGPSWEKKYKILDNDNVEFIETISFLMH